MNTACRWALGKLWQQVARRAWNLVQFGWWIENEVGPFIGYHARKMEDFAAKQYDAVYYRPVTLRRVS
jgi:hypothetical protein